MMTSQLSGSPGTLLSRMLPEWSMAKARSKEQSNQSNDNSRNSKLSFDMIQIEPVEGRSGAGLGGAVIEVQAPNCSVIVDRSSKSLAL